MDTARVSQESRHQPLLPIACTLDAGTGPQRIDEWRLVLADLVERDARPGAVVLHFGDRPGLAAELGRLVAAESVCCSFLGWAVDQTTRGWRVVISGDDEALAALPTGL